MTELEMLAQAWVGDDTGGLERAVVKVRRSDRDEVHLIIDCDGYDEPAHIYLAPDRAVRLAQALIFEASKEGRL